MTDTPKITPDESPMFAGTPSWERNKKRRGFGRVSRAERPAETRRFAAAPASMSAAPMSTYESEPQIDRLGEVDPASSTFAAPPVYASRSQAKSSPATPVAIVAGLILIGGVAAAGWYYTQPHGQTGVAELTPGGATTTTTSDTTTAPAAATPSQLAQNAPPPAAARTTTTTKTTHSAVPTRARSTRSSSASDTAADASTTAPAQAAPMPLPTPGVAPPPAAAPAAPLVLNIPPAATSPAAQAPQPVNPPTTTPQTTAPPPTQVPQA